MFLKPSQFKMYEMDRKEKLPLKVFPYACTSYWPPHRSECIQSLWSETGCREEGQGRPVNQSSLESQYLGSLNLKDAIGHVEDMIRSASDGGKEAQMDCYGIEFPDGCSSYQTPHDLGCYQNMWINAGCSSQGIKYPKSESELDMDIFNDVDLKSLKNKLDQLYVLSSMFDITAQRSCFGMRFPNDCHYFSGPHSMKCLKTIWDESGCLEEGERNPTKLSIDEALQDLRTRTLLQLKEDTNALMQQALDSDPDSQVDCFGIKFPDSCTSYVGPHTVDCLGEVWLKIGCSETGHHSPKNISTDKVKKLAQLDLRSIENTMKESYVSADTGNVEAQLECLGEAFPQVCYSFEGPHSLDCLKSMWLSSGCTEEGHSFPASLAPFQLAELNSMNLLNVKQYYNTLSVGSEYQQHLACYGMDFPLGCRDYYGPHSLLCYQTIWKSAGCTAYGIAYPTEGPQLPTEEYFVYNLRKIKNFIESMVFSAIRLNTQAQFDCYGMQFPGRCIAYWGPHSQECLVEIWLELGCLREGLYFPENLTPDQLNVMANLNLKDIQDSLLNVINMSEKLDKEAQMNCYGMVFSDGCTSYNGPHSLKCYRALWTNASCTSEGRGYPDSLPTSQLNTLNSLNLKQVQTRFQNTFRKSYSFDPEAQQDCYGITLPRHCRSYFGPHSMQCLDTLWWESGCTETGLYRPKDFPMDRQKKMDAMNIRELKTHLDPTRKSSSVHDQLACYGIEFPVGCSSYRGPHNLQCFQSVWTDSGCTVQGAKYPTSLESMKNSSTRLAPLRELKDTVDQLLQLALSRNTQAQIDCFGVVFPEVCVVHMEAQPLQCQQTIWKESGCLTEGSGYPNSTFMHNSLNIDQLQEAIQTAILNAQSGDSVAQQHCYGFSFPPNCTSYKGSNQPECYESIWKLVGCLDRGYASPFKLSSQGLKLLDRLNLREVTLHMQNTFDRATNFDSQAQFHCFGFILPNSCAHYESPYSISCLNRVWVKQGCLVDGYGYPNNLNDEELDFFNRFNISELKNYIKSLTTSLDLDQQRRCFGFDFPQGCRSYNGPHTMECYETIWKNVGCVEEGFDYAPDASMLSKEALENLNLRDLSLFIRDLTQQAMSRDIEAQLGCFGLVFPENCTNFYGPHSLLCLENVWEEADCMKEGINSLDASFADDVAFLMNLSLSELLYVSKQYRNRSRKNDIPAQMLCYGLEFPAYCEMYEGGNPLDCYSTIWQSVGCTENGLGSPMRLGEEDLSFINSSSLRDVKKYMSNTFKKAIKQDRKAQQDCFGRVLPLGCSSLTGPHSLECLDAMWHESGCLADGHGHPSKMITEDINKLNSMNIQQIEAKFKKSASKPSIDQQLACYGYSFPEGCVELRSKENTRACFTSLWIRGGCIEDGDDFPENLNELEFSAVQNLSIPEYEKHVKSLAVNLRDKKAQLDCFGTLIPPPCTSYKSGHSLECVQSLWRDSGCIVKGKGYPAFSFSPEHMGLQESDLRTVQTFVEDLYLSSQNGSEDAQLQCYGLIFVNGCQSYTGPHSRNCYESLWKSVGCTNDKYAWLKQLDRTNSSAKLNLRDLRAHMENTYLKSSMFDTQAQLDCFDFEFPQGCRYYQGSHSDECLHNIWTNYGCLEDGLRYPRRLNDTEKEMLNTKTLHNIKQSVIKLSKLSGVQAQVECYGFEFPQGCTSFNAPHSLQCYKSLWKNYGCIQEGSIFPVTYDVVNNSALQNMNLLDLKRAMRNIVDNAISSNQQAQLDCFGIIFPSGCVRYDGEHSLECLIQMWNEYGCIEEGEHYPQKLKTTDLNQISTMNLIALRDHILGIKGNENFQSLCYGMTFPEGCISYNGAHLMSCYKTIWKEIGCLDQGQNWPDELAPKELSTLNTLNLRELFSRMKNTFEKAFALNTQAQLDCFGMVLPRGCNTFDGPHNIACLNSLWSEGGCKENGRRNPKFLPDNEKDLLSNLTIHEILDYIHLMTEMPNSTYQMDCYGFVFSSGCTTYNGPHDLNCYQSIWKDGGCVESGEDYPRNETDLLTRTWNELDLAEVKTYVETLADQAGLNDPIAQQKCFGITFPTNCMNYHGPHSYDCQHNVWKKIGCSDEGLQYFQNAGKTLANRNLQDIVENVENLLKSTKNADPEAQMECYGLRFPGGCDSYMGSRNIQCYDSIWENVGCLPQGYDAPSNLSDYELATIENFNLREVRQLMENTFLKAQYGDVRAQRDCFGFAFPKGCLQFEGPHSIECYLTIWLEAGCLKEGIAMPHNESSPFVTLTSHLNLLQLHDVISQMSFINSTNELAQLHCYGFVVPDDCHSFEGPHSTDCLNSLWISSGCLASGDGFPILLTSPQISHFSLFNIKDFINYVRSVAQQSSMNNAEAQLDCYGRVFPKGCTSFSGPHSLECQITIWTTAGCSPEGTRYPRKLNVYQTDIINTAVLTELEQYVSNIFANATSGNEEAQSQCFGLVFPPSCIQYKGIQPLGCYKEMWKKAGCTDSGWGKPSSATLKDFGNLNIRQLSEKLQELIAASSMDPKSQLACYGVEFPSNCKRFEGPLTPECYLSIFKNSGCTKDGFPFVQHLLDQEDDLMSMTILDVTDYFARLNARAQNNDPEYQQYCYGFGFPEKCEFYSGPNSRNCYETIWDDVGCLSEGHHSPSSLSPAAVNALDDLNLRDIRQYMNTLHNMALSSNEQAQRDCYGLAFPQGCSLYDGSHPLRCLNMIWTKAGCLKSGSGYPGKLTSDKLAPLTSITLRELITYFDHIIKSAHNGEKVDQVACYGLEFPKGCRTYQGPHSRKCLASMWKSTGCSDKGLQYPEKTSSQAALVLSPLNIRQITERLKQFAAAARGLNAKEQRDCFGIGLMDGCTNYEGPHSMPCYAALWNGVGCLDDGHLHPVRMDEKNKKFIDTLDLHDLVSYFEDIASNASVGFENYQLDCYGIEFRDECPKFHAPLPIDCLHRLWLDVAQCSPEGAAYPRNLDKLTLNEDWKGLNQKEAIIAMQGIKDKVLAEDRTHIYDCYGVVLPKQCDTYFQNLSLACLQKLWLDAGCNLEGTQEPGKLTKEELSAYKSMNYRDASESIKKFFSSAARSNARSEQFQCFGTELPPDCFAFNSGLPYDCLLSMWLLAGCKIIGSLSPTVLEDEDLSKIWGTQNLTQAAADMNRTFLDAAMGDLLATYHCYGEEPPKCMFSESKVPDECLQYLWLATGCNEEGELYPLKKQRISIWNRISLLKATVQCKYQYNMAMKGYPEHQRNCFGTAFPSRCDAFTGPFTDECLISVWLESGCIEEGYFYLKLTLPGKHELLHDMNLARMRHHVDNAFVQSSEHNQAAQYVCFGMVFPGKCQHYESPHTMECIKNIWLNEGCTLYGILYPTNYSSIQDAGLDAVNLRDLIKRIKEIRLAADKLSQQAQVECYGLYFPKGCLKYYRPFAIECVQTIMARFNLTQDPTTFPPVLNILKSAGNLHELIELIRNITIGMKEEMDEFGDDIACPSPFAPLSLECLNDIWTVLVGCSDRGLGFPGSLENATRERLYGRVNLRTAMNMIQGIKDKAASDNESQLQCYGTTIPFYCERFDSPLPRRCLNMLWLNDVGCAEPGLGYPGSLSDSDFRKTYGDKNLLEAKDEFATIKENALNLENRYYRDCYGTDIPLWIYGITAAAIKSVMYILGGLLMLGLLYVIYRICVSFPPVSTEESYHPKAPYRQSVRMNRQSGYYPNKQLAML